MRSLDEAKAHLEKAEEFLVAAVHNHDLGLYSAATSDAVVSGINAKDAICLKLTGSTRKADDHTAAVAELRRAGREGAQLAQTLDRLLKLKSKAQYQTSAIPARDADHALRWAGKLSEAARRIVTA